jgi:ribonuclease HI
MSTRSGAHGYISLSDTAIADLLFWSYCFKTFERTRKVWQNRTAPIIIFTDAAGRNLSSYGGWGGWTSRDGLLAVAKGIWSEIEGSESSTLMELQAILHVVKSFNSKEGLNNNYVLIKTDNQGVFFIINKAGSHVPAIHTIAKELWWYCINNNIDIRATWIPRDLNTWADFYSKLIETSDWKINPIIFLSIQKIWGIFDIDLFASFNNHQVQQYYSLYWTPDASGVDAFMFQWGRQCWCYPPFNQIARVLAHARSCKARLCLICPYTPSARWWHRLIANESMFNNFVRGCIPLAKRPELILSGRLGYQPCRAQSWQFMALLIDFKVMPAQQVPVPQERDFHVDFLP